MTDDLLAKIDAALAALFPPDATLTDDDVEALLDRELDDEDARAPGRGSARLDLDLVYGLEGSEVIFVERSTAEWIEATLPRVQSGELDWEDDVPWVQRDQETVLPADVIECWGTYASTALDGPVVTFRAEDAEAIVEWLEERGATCARDDDLVGRVCSG